MVVTTRAEPEGECVVCVTVPRFATPASREPTVADVGAAWAAADTCDDSDGSGMERGTPAAAEAASASGTVA
jgi:hypothetical protein